MGSLSFCSLKQFINEEIYSDEATLPANSIQSVIDSKREVGYDQLSSENLKTLELNHISYMNVPREDNLKYYIFYTNKEKALRLLEISQNHGGKLQDTSFEEAVEIGRLLGYHASSIDEYVFRRYYRHYKPYVVPIIDYPDLHNLHDE
jgi:hypothetical protein